jgi:hypothetical protein
MRGQVRRGDHHWLELANNPSDEYISKFEINKLIYPEISPSIFVSFDKKGFYANAKCFILTSNKTNLKYLGAIISSSALNFFSKFVGTTLEGNRFNLSKNFVERLPIYPATIQEQKPIIEFVDKIIQLNHEFQVENNGFKNWLKQTYKVEKFSQKLDKYYKLSFDAFLAELNKKKVDTKTRKTQELLKNEFEDSVNKINPYFNK